MQGISAKRDFKIFTQALIAETYSRVCQLTPRELKKMYERQDSPAIETVIARALLNDIKNSQTRHTENILSRIIGAVPIVTVSSSPLSPGDVSTLKDEELDAIIKRNLKTQ